MLCKVIFSFFSVEKILKKMQLVSKTLVNSIYQSQTYFIFLEKNLQVLSSQICISVSKSKSTILESDVYMYNQIETAKEFFKMSENVADPIIAIILL